MEGFGLHKYLENVNIYPYIFRGERSVTILLDYMINETYVRKLLIHPVVFLNLRK